MVGLLWLAKLLTIFGRKLKKWDTAGTVARIVDNRLSPGTLASSHSPNECVWASVHWLSGYAKLV